MADNITQLIDIVTPEIYNQYMNNFTAEKSAFIQSGVAVADERVSKNITAGGLLVHMPFWNDLTGDDEVLGDGDKALTTGKITSSLDQAAVLYRGRGWAVNELAGVIAGDKPMDALMAKLGAYRLRREQQALIAVLNGLFAEKGAAEDAVAGPLNATHLNSKKTSSINAELILDTKQLLGDASEQLSVIVMHSAIKTSLQKQNLIENIPNARGEIVFQAFMGYRIVVDDGVPTFGTGTSTSYQTYLLRGGSFGRNSGNPAQLTTFETDRDSAKGNDRIFTRWALTMHPYGVKWNDSTREDGNITPTNVDLANPANWTKVYEDKQIGIVSLISKA